MSPKELLEYENFFHSVSNETGICARKLIAEIRRLRAENTDLFNLARLAGGCAACRHQRDDVCHICNWTPDIPGFGD